MRKLIVLSLACLLAISYATSCKPKVKETPPPPPQAKEQPRVERVAPPAPVQKPQLSDEEIFLAKSLDQINKEKPLRMINFDYDKFVIRDDATGFPYYQDIMAEIAKLPDVKGTTAMIQAYGLVSIPYGQRASVQPFVRNRQAGRKTRRVGCLPLA